MQTQTILTNLITSFVLGGGLGYINYFILQNLCVINLNEKNKEEKTFTLILFSIINIILYQTLEMCINNYVFSIAITFVLSMVLSFTIFKWIMDIIYKIINEKRTKDNLGKVSNKSVRTHIFNKNITLFVYIYDLQNNLLSYGCMGWQDEDSDDFEFEVIPFPELDKMTFDDAVNKANKNDDMSIYINVDKNIKIVVIPESQE